jgi:16S rRNA (guanine1516-N2)-methyltransferase
MITAEIAIVIEDSTRESEGRLLAKQLGIPIISHEKLQTYPMILSFTKERIELLFPQEQLRPLYVDFLDKATTTRLQKCQGRNELIAKAVGIKKGYLPVVIDTTAGLGGDAIILAFLGCRVEMIERSRVICALLQDAMRRAQIAHPPWLSNLSLICDDAKDFLRQQIEAQRLVDVVYMDPMFPERSKSALVKKEMRILKRIVGSDVDAAQLFELAKQCAKRRIVVKRPLHAEPLVREKPAIIYKARAFRFDVYVLVRSTGI